MRRGNQGCQHADDTPAVRAEVEESRSKRLIEPWRRTKHKGESPPRLSVPRLRTAHRPGCGKDRTELPAPSPSPGESENGTYGMVSSRESPPPVATTRRGAFCQDVSHAHPFMRDLAARRGTDRRATMEHHLARHPKAPADGLSPRHQAEEKSQNQKQIHRYCAFPASRLSLV